MRGRRGRREEGGTVAIGCNDMKRTKERKGEKEEKLEN